MPRAKKQSWPADKIVRWPIEKLTPQANNARTHTDEQIAQIAGSMKEWGWTNPILVDETGSIIAGHGRVMAARLLDIDSIPAIVAKGWTKAQIKAYALADNQIPLNAGWDVDLLRIELQGLSELDFELDKSGFSADFMSELFFEPSFKPGNENDQGNLDGGGAKCLCPSCGEVFDPVINKASADA